MNRRYRLVDAGGRNNNCMILSVIEGAREQFGVCNHMDMEEKAKDIRKEISELISRSTETELGNCAFEAMRILNEWRTANPREFSSEVSCPSADHCMHIEDKDEALMCVSAFVPQNRMMGAIELPFLKEIAKGYGVHIVEATRSNVWKDLEDWVDTQIALAPANMKVSVIVSDGTHYQSLKPVEQPTPSTENLEFTNQLTTRKRKPVADDLCIPKKKHTPTTYLKKKADYTPDFVQDCAMPKNAVLSIIKNTSYFDWAFIALVGMALWTAFKPRISRFWMSK